MGHAPQNERLLLAPLVVMGMPLWQPPGPNGWPDTVAAWATPKGMKSRLDVAAAIAARVKETLHPNDLLDTCIGQVASNETRAAITRAELREQGLALVLMSPEFQWSEPMSRCEMPWPTRRTVLLGGSAMFAWAQLPRLASASGTCDPRFIVIVLRGALDGLAAVAPVGDPNMQRLHGQIALRSRGSIQPSRSTARLLLHRPCRCLPACSSKATLPLSTPRRPAIASAPTSTAKTPSKAAFPGPVDVQSGWLNRAIAAVVRKSWVAPRGSRRWSIDGADHARPSAAVLGWVPRIANAASDDLALASWTFTRIAIPVPKTAMAQGLETDRSRRRAGIWPAPLLHETRWYSAMRPVAEGAAS